MDNNDCGFDREQGWFRLRAAAMILEKGHVLMAQNVKDLYYYSIGGAVRLHESVEEAVLRECREETGVAYEIDRLCFIHQNFFEDRHGKPFHEIAFYYLMKPCGSLRLEGHDVSMHGHHEHAVWVPLTQLPSLYAFPFFYRDRLAKLPETVEMITTREAAAHRETIEKTSHNTAFLPTDDLADGRIRLRCIWRMERDTIKGYAPSYHFEILLEENGQVAGQCGLRLGEGEEIAWMGNIEYLVFEAYRRQGLATRACGLLFALARAHGMTGATIHCDPVNLASAKTARSAGAAYERTLDIPAGHPMRRKGMRQVIVFRRQLT